MEARAARFRQSVADRTAGRPRRRFSEAEREEALSYLDDRRAQGASIAGVAKELGLSKNTLEQWRLRRRRFVAVSVGAPAGEVALVSPGGFRVEGLSLAQAADLLRRLG